MRPRQIVRPGFDSLEGLQVAASLIAQRSKLRGTGAFVIANLQRSGKITLNLPSADYDYLNNSGKRGSTEANHPLRTDVN